MTVLASTYYGDLMKVRCSMLAAQALGSLIYLFNFRLRWFSLVLFVCAAGESWFLTTRRYTFWFVPLILTCINTCISLLMLSGVMMTAGSLQSVMDSLGFVLTFCSTLVSVLAWSLIWLYSVHAKVEQLDFTRSSREIREATVTVLDEAAAAA